MYFCVPGIWTEEKLDDEDQLMALMQAMDADIISHRGRSAPQGRLFANFNARAVRSFLTHLIAFLDLARTFAWSGKRDSQKAPIGLATVTCFSYKKI